MPVMMWLDWAEAVLQVAGLLFAAHGLLLTWTAESPDEPLLKPPADWIRARWRAVRYSRPVVALLKRIGLGPQPVTIRVEMVAPPATVSGRLHVYPPALDPALQVSEALATLADRIRAIDERISNVKDGADDADAAIRVELETSARRLQDSIDRIQEWAHRRVVSGVRQEVLGLSLVVAATTVGFVSRLVA